MIYIYLRIEEKFYSHMFQLNRNKFKSTTRVMFKPQPICMVLGEVALKVLDCSNVDYPMISIQVLSKIII